MFTLLALSSLVIAADPPPAKNDVVKGLVKDALTQPLGTSDAGTERHGLDVSKMPFTPDTIKQVVASWQPQIQGCYEEHLAAKDKAVEGTLKTSFVITPEGMVKSARVNKKTSSLKDSRLHDCVVAVLSSMEFPKPPSGKPQPIEYPFNLKALH